MMTRFAIMGTGGVGGYFGARLAAGGHEVAFIARGAHLEVIRGKGLRVESANGDVCIQTARVTDAPSEIGPVDYVLFATKLWDTETAGEAIRPLVGPETAVISFQNGVDAEERLAGILGAEHIMGGVAFIAATIAAPGVIHHTGTLARLVFGELDRRRSPRAESLLAALGESAIEAEIADDIERSIWEKFVFLAAVSGVTSVTRHRMGAVRKNRETRALLRDAMSEAVAVARARGIDMDPVFVEERMRFADSLPAEMTSSMHQDLERGNRLELPWLSGAVARMGSELGVQTPVSTFITTALGLSADGRGEDPPP